MVQISEDTPADRALLNRIVARDQMALAELYDRHARLLFGLIVRIVKDRAEAEEVLQEAFLAAWTRAETYNESLGSPVGWLVRIARNRGIDRLRANNARGRAADASLLPSAAESPELNAARSEQQRAVTQALGTLPTDQRALIEQAYFTGLTQSELAARFNLPLGTVKTRVRTGLIALRQRLQQSVEQ